MKIFERLISKNTAKSKDTNWKENVIIFPSLKFVFDFFVPTWFRLKLRVTHPAWMIESHQSVSPKRHPVNYLIIEGVFSICKFSCIIHLHKTFPKSFLLKNNMSFFWRKGVFLVKQTDSKNSDTILKVLKSICKWTMK